MSYKYDHGDGRLKDVEITDGVFGKMNSYGRVTAINGAVITVENILEGEFSKFTAGEKVIIHVSATNGVETEKLGKYQIAVIELVSENRLTLSARVFDVDLNYYYVQVIVIPQFKNLTLKNAKVTPAPFDVFKFRGGIIAFQVFDTFKMENAQIDLTECGIPVTKKNTYRPLTEQEYFETDKSLRAGEENLITASKFLLNAGDGAVFVSAKEFIADELSRIGNPKTHGRAKCRGAADSPFKPSNTTNIGGSSILIAADHFNAPLEILAKYRSADAPAGKGLSRCFVASNTLLPHDDKLYAFDIPRNLSRVQSLGVHNFGAGTISLDKPTFQLNNFATVDNCVDNKIFFSQKTINGYATFQPNGLILIRNANGVFTLSRTLLYNNNFVIVDNRPDEPTEIISVPQFDTLTLENFTADKFLGVAVNGVLTLSGDINVTNFLQLNCGNAQSWNKISGIFILAREIIFEENCRLNAGAMIITNAVKNFNALIYTNAPNFIYQRS